MPGGPSGQGSASPEGGAEPRVSESPSQAGVYAYMKIESVTVAP
ncbi:hypothetical protein [Streptomyces ipomoeae]|nr:hypothetical protein [Streptomyces ipomoeae]